MNTLLGKPGKMVVQFDTSDHKIYFNLDSRGVRGTLVVTKNNDGRTAMRVYKEDIGAEVHKLDQLIRVEEGQARPFSTALSTHTRAEAEKDNEHFDGKTTE